MDDSIRKDHDWELFDCLSLFLRNVSRENWTLLDNVWCVNKDRFFSKVRNVSSNI
ncbi:Protein Ycf2 [Bienertia sinuspersici]